MRAQKRQGKWQPLEGERDDEAIERQFALLHKAGQHKTPTSDDADEARKDA